MRKELILTDLLSASESEMWPRLKDLKPSESKVYDIKTVGDCSSNKLRLYKFPIFETLVL